MARVELAEETKAAVEDLATADVLIAVVAPADAAQLRSAAEDAMRAPALSGLRAVITAPGIVADPVESAAADGMRFVPYTQAAGGSPLLPRVPAASTFQAIFALARELQVKACAVIGFDLAALHSNFLAATLPVLLEKGCDLAMPLYATGKFDGLINASILFPLTRALYGKRVRFPLPSDFCVSQKVIPQMEAAAQKVALQGQSLFWPATEAAFREASICQVHVDTRHTTVADGVDLTTVLVQTVGPLFADMTLNASLWQRIRGSQPVPASGFPATAPAEGPAADTRPMVESFQLGFRNLQEVWSLVLPPVTLLDLKRLTRAGQDRLQMPDDLWARIIYDFALAHRLRTLSRTHLLGALAPLYLGWVASYAAQVSNLSAAEAEQRLDKLARAFEETKPYLLQRWRWPDRFNP